MTADELGGRGVPRLFGRVDDDGDPLLGLEVEAVKASERAEEHDDAGLHIQDPGTVEPAPRGAEGRAGVDGLLVAGRGFEHGELLEQMDHLALPGAEIEPEIHYALHRRFGPLIYHSARQKASSGI